MNHSQSKNSKKRRSPLVWLLLLLLLSVSFGGVAAYLSMTSNVADNSFTNAQYPEVTVSGTTVTVNPNGYEVFLRVSVDMCWENKSDPNTVLAEEPTSGFSIGGDDWNKIGDFYYYMSPISQTVSLTPVTVSNLEKGNYTLVAKIAAQVIQAVGDTDPDAQGNTKPAVQDAWGVTPEQIKGN